MKATRLPFVTRIPSAIRRSSALRIAPALCAALLLAGCATPFPSATEQLNNAEPAAPQLDIQSWHTDEGARVLFVASPSLPMLDVRLVSHAGGAHDDGLPGLASLTSALLGEGAKGLSVDDISKGFENKGADFSTGSYRDMAVISLRTLTKPEWRQASIDLLTRVIGQPTFPQKALDRVRTQMMQGLRMQKQVPGPQVQKLFQQTLFGDHPYGHDENGTLESLPKIKRADLQHYYQTYYRAANTVIALVGDISTDQAHAIATQISKALPQGPAAAALPMAHRLSQPVLKHIDFASSQTHILIGNQATRRGDPDHAALFVGNYILGGGGFASLLTQQVREKKGYVYGISSYFQPMAAGGPFILQLQTANKYAQPALDMTLSILRDFIANGPTPQQLKTAKSSILGSMALATASNSAIIGQLGAIGFYDLPLNYLQQFNQQIKAVTVTDIKQAFQRALNPNDLAIVSIGPKALALPAAQPGDVSQNTAKQ